MKNRKEITDMTENIKQTLFQEGSVNLSKSPPYYNNQQIGETSLQHALVYICSYYMENNHQNSQFYL
jgi:hypothetical protein